MPTKTYMCVSWASVAAQHGGSVEVDPFSTQGYLKGSKSKQGSKQNNTELQVIYTLMKT